MIIWLASYPKSGNTLLRGILATYFFSKDGNFDFKYLYKIGQFPSLIHFKNLGIDISDDVKMDFAKVKKYANKDIVSSGECGFIEDMLLYLLNDLEGFDLFEEDEKLYSEIVMFVMKDISNGSDSSKATIIR